MWCCGESIKLRGLLPKSAKAESNDVFCSYLILSAMNNLLCSHGFHLRGPCWNLCLFIFNGTTKPFGYRSLEMQARHLWRTFILRFHQQRWCAVAKPLRACIADVCRRTRPHGIISSCIQCTPVGATTPFVAPTTSSLPFPQSC